MKKLLGVAFVIVALSGVGFAQRGFAGPSLSGLYFSNLDESGSDLTLGFLGGQVGSYTLLGPVGGRITVDFSVSPISGFLSGSVDLIAASGGDTRFYGGAGVGVLSFFGLTAPFAKGFVGVDFTVSDGVNLFVEATPIYVFQAQNFLLGGRFGVNFGFGG